MANRFNSPDQQFCDGTGAPYAGGFLNFYAAGTSTPLNTYSDSALITPNANPVILDSAGRAGSIFLQNLAYKVVLSDVNNNQIWTEDPVYSSDYSTSAQFITYPGNPNGNVAGTAGSGMVPSSVVWDSIDAILYVCITTGSAAAAVWTAVNASATSQVTPAPSGRLTLVSQTPVISSDQIGATTVYYTPYTDNNVPIYNGTSVVANAFSEITLGLVANHAADSIYDVFIFNNSSVLTLVTGPAWTNITAGSCARGSGAGTTQLTKINGHLVNAVQITGRNGATTYTIAANQATYLGTIFMDHTAGQVTCHTSFGQNRKFGVWNAYNRVPIVLLAGDSTASWTYTTATIRASNNVPSSYAGTSFNVGSGTTCNGMTVLTGLAEEVPSLEFLQWVQQSTGGATSTSLIGIGYNSTTAFSGINGSVTGGSQQIGSTALSEHFPVPGLGINVVAALEKGGGNTGTYSGTSSNMLLTAQWRG